VTNQFTGEFVDLDTFEVINPPAPKVQNARAQHHADVFASAVEYVSVHGTPPSLARPRAGCATQTGKAMEFEARNA
jgi:hypothetical protein